MYIIMDSETQSAVGPFETYEDAHSFVAKVEEMSNLTVIGLDVHELTDGDEWVLDNMDNILMSNC